jgi:hypothetical protein
MASPRTTMPSAGLVCGVRYADRAIQPTVFAMQGERMSNAAPLQPTLTEHSLSERILALAAQGLRVRDISSLLHIHPEIVRRVLEEQAKAQ